MIPKFAVIILAAFAAFHLVAAGYTCPDDQTLYCCAGEVPDSYAIACFDYNQEHVCGGDVRCCDDSDELHNGFGCTAPNSS